MSDETPDTPGVGHNSAPLLEVLKEKMLYHNNRVRHGARLVVDDVVEEGRAGIQAKKIVGHGNWDTWLKSNCLQCQSTIVARMRIARGVDAGKIKSAELTDLSVNRIIGILAKRRKVDPVANKKHKIELKLKSLAGKSRSDFERNRLSDAWDALDDEEVLADEIIQQAGFDLNLLEPPAWGQLLRISWAGDSENTRQAVYIWLVARDTLSRTEQPKFKWLMFELNEVWADRRLYDVSTEDGDLWDEVLERLSQTPSGAEYTLLSYDPVRTTLVEEFWAFVDMTKVREQQPALQDIAQDEPRDDGEVPL